MAILKAQVNVPLTVTLTSPLGEEAPSQFENKIQYKYLCLEGLIYADNKLHAALAPHAEGTTVTILKTQAAFTAADGSARRMNNYAVSAEGSTAPPSTAPPSTDNHLPNSATTPAAPPPQHVDQAQAMKAPQHGTPYADVVWLLSSCMQSVESIAPEAYTAAERQSAAISLFIGCQQKGIKPPTAETADAPMPVSATEVYDGPETTTLPDPDELPF